MADRGASVPLETAPLDAPKATGLIPPYGVVACSVVFFWSISVRSLLYTVMPTIAADLQLSSSVGGIAIATMLLGYCAGSWFAGWLPGRRKGRILAGILLSLPGAALFSVAGSLWVLLGAALLVGLGVGIYLPLGLALIVDAGGEGRRAYYMAIHELAATLASFSGSSYVAIILSRTDWRGSILLWIAVGVMALLIFVPVQDRDGKAARHGPSEPLPKGRLLVYSLVAYSVGTMLVMGLISVLPLIMVRGWGIDQAHAASVVGYTRLAGLVGVVAVGLFADRWGHSRVLIGLLSLCLVGGVAMSLDGYGPLFVGGMLLVAAGAAGNIGLLPLVIAEAFLPSQRERVLSVAGGVGGILGMVASPALFGVLLDAGLPSGPILVAAAGAFLAILATAGIAAHRISAGVRSA